MTDKLKEAIGVLKMNRPLIGRIGDGVMEAIDTVIEALEYPTYTSEEMYLNMQYYMEYCQMKGYVTPMEWLEKHKHFGKEAATRGKASQVGKEATEL